MKSKLFYAVAGLLLLMTGVSVCLYFTNEGVATEFRQIRQPNPNRFYVGIDVSATIEQQTLDDLKNNITSRLRHFIGDKAVSYSISAFGNPGCGELSVKQIVSERSPADDSEFSWEVEKKIETVKAAEAPKSGKPLTTPLYYLLEKILPENPGGRIIIFSDLMNDDSECPKQYLFPEEAVEKFGADKNGQLVFIYPTPVLTSTPEFNERIMKRQQDFIEKMQALVMAGKVRAFFYHIPDDSEKRSAFIKSQLENSIPVTKFEIVWERTYKVIDTIVSAVRG